MVTLAKNVSTIAKIKADIKLAELARQDSVEKTHLEAKIWLKLLGETIEKSFSERAISLL